MTRALHMRRATGEATDMRVSLCGMLAVDVTDDATEVTCMLCRRALERDADAAAVEHLGEERRVVPKPRTLAAWQRRIVERSIAGEDACETRARFPSWEALHEHCARVIDDGCPVRSSSRPERFAVRVQPSGAVRTPSGREDIIEVERVLRAATAKPRRIGPHVLGQEAQLAIYLARCEGRPLVGRTAEGRKGTITRRVPMSAEDVARAIGGDWTARHVGMLVRAVRADAGPMMAAKGILPARVRQDRQERDMRVDGYDLEGWKEIAAVIGKSEDTAQRYERDYGLPVVRLRTGRVIAKRADVCAWKLRMAGILDAQG